MVLVAGASQPAQDMQELLAQLKVLAGELGVVVLPLLGFEVEHGEEQTHRQYANLPNNRRLLDVIPQFNQHTAALNRRE